MHCTDPYPKKMINAAWDGVNPLTKYSYILVPCGKCLACRINRRREWTARLQQELIFSSCGYFVTLTYDQEHLPHDARGNPSVCKRDIQLFLKRLRKKYGSGLRYFLNSEYGPDTHRPHYHSIIFNLPQDLPEKSRRCVRFWNGRKSIFYLNDDLTRLWGKGDVEFSDVTKERCGYCAKYFVSRQDVPEGYSNNFSLISKGRRTVDGLGGIGYRYGQAISDKVRYNSSLYMYSPSNGHPVALPRYYKDIIFSDEERKEMTERYIEDYKLDEKYISMIENHRNVEANQYRAMTFKLIKSKI